jgi:tetratricopeptide (TPR) repeat protein
MTKMIIILSFIFLSWNVSMEDIKRVWKGHYSPGDLAKWGKRLEKRRSMNKWGGVAFCSNAIGVIHFFEGDFDEALRHLNQSLQTSRENGFEGMVARNLHWIGVAQRKKGLHAEAFKSLNESLEIAKGAGMTGIVGNNLRHIGLLLMAKGRHRESMDYLERSIDPQDSGEP